jgi:hypothetical protein
MGRDLVADVDSGQFDAQIAEALKGIWPSLPGGSQSNTSMMTYLRRITDARAARTLGKPMSV